MQDAPGKYSEQVDGRVSARSCATRFRSSTVRVLVLAGVVAVFLVAPIVLHEAVHVFMAVITGVSPYDMDVGFVGAYPGVKVHDSLDGWRLSLFHYSGGLVTGTVMVYVYIRWYWGWSGNKTSFVEWWLGALILVTAGTELGNGIAEGAYNAEYVANRDPAIIISLVATVGGFVVHRMMLGSRGARLAVIGTRSKRVHGGAGSRSGGANSNE